jgi:DNA polymerase elongation subunit (family B)
MYFDIEVYNYGSKEFPDPKDAPSPINCISWKINDGPVNVFLTKHKNALDTKIKPIKNIKIKTFSSEKQLLKGFFSVFQENNVDLLCGWNSDGFDIPYIYNRSRKTGIDISLISPLKMVDINIYRFSDYDFFGLVTVDLMRLYKNLTYNVEESYSLDFISNKQLKTGKVSYSGSLDELYENNLNEFIKYSMTDTDLLYKLDKKLKHISLIFEIIKICSTTWKASKTTTGQVDPLCISYANKKDLVCRNGLGEKTEEKIPGAYVRHPKSGLHGNIIDLDFSSLYPSIIRSCNIGPNTYVSKIEQNENNKLFLNKKEKENVYFNKIAFDWIYNKNNMDEDITLILNPMFEKNKKITVTKEQFEQYLEKIDGIVTVSGCIYKGHDSELSFFNEILTYLMDSRKEYKNKLKKSKNEEESKRFDNIQLAYKILANSLYGVLANHGFRFFNLDMAKTITLTGQELVKFSGYHLGEYLEKNSKDININYLDNYDNKDIPYLIYQDTDSLFIQLGDYLINKGNNQ